MAEPSPVSTLSMQPIPKDGSSVHTGKNRTVRSKQFKPVPDSAPSRNLRSSKNTGSECSQAPVPTLQLHSSPRSRLFSTTAKQATATSHQKNGNQVKKPASHKYRLLASEVPTDIGGLQVRSIHLILDNSSLFILFANRKRCHYIFVSYGVYWMRRKFLETLLSWSFASSLPVS
jgi:hypothetical protein